MERNSPRTKNLRFNEFNELIDSNKEVIWNSDNEERISFEHYDGVIVDIIDLTKPITGRRKRVLMDWGKLNGYSPEKVTGGDYEPFKGKYSANVNYCRIEPYEGDKEEYKGREFIRYELEICEGQANAGRRLWKSIDPMDENTDKKGKTRLQKFADTLFTVGLTPNFGNPKEVEKALDDFTKLTVEVSCGYFTPEGKDEPVQTHVIKGIAKEKGTVKSSEIPF